MLKKYSIENLRNVVLVGHQSSGKTTLGEAMLFDAGVTNRMGKVEDGNTVLDASPDEIERQISISSGFACFEASKTKVNIMDTPGYEDFVGEVLSCVPVAEGGVVVISADSGVEVGTEKTWRYLDGEKLPRIVCVNKMDKEHADFDKCLADAQKFLSSRVMPLIIPIGQGDSFTGVVDLLQKKAFVYTGTDGAFTEAEVPDDLAGPVNGWRKKLMDFAAESDDSLLEKFFEAGELTDEELAKGLSDGCRAGTLVPLVVTSAAKNIGVKQLVEMIVTLLPSPEWRGVVKAKSASGGLQDIKVGPDQPTLAFIFKTLSEKHAGDLSFVRVYSGEMEVGDDLHDSTIDTAERIGQLYFVQGKNRIDTGAIPAGDIGAAVKLKAAKINHTLTERSNQVILAGIKFPEPSLHTAIAAKGKGEMEKVASGLHKLAEEDPTFKVEPNAELRQTILSGQGELHFDVILGRLKRKYQVEVEMEPPKVPYRETITAHGEAQGKHKKQTGGRGQYGDVWIKVDPLPRGGGFEFVNAIVGGVVPSKYIPAVEKGVVEAMKAGSLSGCHVMDVKVTLFDGSFHTVDSSDQAFKVAGSKGFKAALQKAKPVILEPIMDVEVLVPDEYMGDVMGDLSMRRGKIQGTEQSGKQQKIKAQVPLAELYRYSTTLRSMTQGKASHRREFSHYEIVPHEISQKLAAEAAAAREESS